MKSSSKFKKTTQPTQPVPPVAPTPAAELPVATPTPSPTMRARPKGLAIIGTGFGCGKTIVLTGLAATLHEAMQESLQATLPDSNFDSPEQTKFLARAIKPICFGDRYAAESELAFISTISHTASNYPVQYISSVGALKRFQQAEALRLCRSGTELTLVELPGSAATPLSFTDGIWQDTCDFAKELNWPCILVTNFADNCLEQLILNAEYLKRAELEISGIVIVKTEPDLPGSEQSSTIPEFALIALQEKVGAPFLGTLQYSPSISVPKVHQGNLIKTTSAALDLLPILKLFNLAIAI